MKLIDRHLFRELLIPLAYCFCGFAMILVVGELFGDADRILEARPGGGVIVRYYLATLGPMLQFLMPASLMLATLYTLYGLTRHNELIAMRACGISLYRLVVPFVVVGFVLSALTATLNELWVPRTYEWAEQLKAARFDTTALQNTYESCIYLNPTARRQWIVEKLDPGAPHLLHRLEVKQEHPNGKRHFVVTARKAQFLDGQWWFFDPWIQRFGDHDNPVGTATRLGTGPDSIVHMRDFNERPEAFVSAVRHWEFLNVREMLHYIRSHPEMSARSFNEKSFSFHNRMAMPWACLIVVFFAIPAGAKTGRQGVLPAVFTAIALMAGFYTMAQVGLVLGSTGTIPPWLGAWLSNITFGMVGLILLKRLR